MLNKGGWHGLRGASKKEPSREELLQQARVDRAARSDAKQRSRAAAVIQAHWRGHAVRVQLQQQLLQEWHNKYAAAAAQQNTVLPVAEVFNGPVRLLLMALLPCGSASSKRLIARGHPLQLSSVQPNSSNSGGSAYSAIGVLKGTLALALRSITSSNGQPASVRASTEFSSQALQVQVLQFCQLCCLVLASQQSDTVLDAAASRLLQLAAKDTQWLCPAASSTDAATAASTAHVVQGLHQKPRPLLHALSRLSSMESLQQQCQGAGSGGIFNAAAARTAGLQRVFDVAITALEVFCCAKQQPWQGFTDQFVLVVMTTPGLAVAAAGPIKARLLDPAVLRLQLLPVSTRLASQGQLSGLAALHCLANLAQLVTGCSPLPNKSNDRQPQLQAATGASQPFSDPQTAWAFCGAVMHLLAAASKPASKSFVFIKQHKQRLHNGRNAANGSQYEGEVASNDISQANGSRASATEVLQQGCWMLASQQHLLQLMKVLTSHSQDGIVVWAGYCVHLLQDCHRITQLSGKKEPNAATDSKGNRNSIDSSSLSKSVLNVIAFHPGLLPAMWRWLALTAGLPLEAPLQASRGLDIAAVAGGPEGMQPHVVLVLGLFCRSLAQLLLVLDDADLHTHQTPFSLGTSRAVVSTLNSLVFHTWFPDASQALKQHQQRQQQLPQQRMQQQQQALAITQAATTAAYGMELVRQHAPVVLRGYYERDARQRFCQPNLWTEPYSNLMASLNAQHKQERSTVATTAAVVQALLVGVGLGSEDSDGDNPATSITSPALRAGASSSGSPVSPATVVGAGVPGLRTGALASLLRCAPQAVPFCARLELFRQMLQQDKARGRWNLSPVEGGPPSLKLTVRRDVLLEDAYRGLGGAGHNIKARLQVTFVNAQGLAEAGIDQGGLMKELLEQIVAAGTQPEYGLFTTTQGSGLLYPNPAAEAIPQGLALLKFLGMMVGKALYEGILLNLSFAPFFLLSLQGGRPGLDDLAGLDSTLHTSLLAVKACPAADVEHLGLTFAAEQQLFGKTVESELLPGGSSLPVTADNRLLYVHLLADWHLNARLGRAAAAFAGGLSGVLPPSWLHPFSPEELNELMSGGQDEGLDIDDMARYVQYSNGYSESSSTIKMFWTVVSGFTAEQRRLLLRFITSTSRAPLGGFKHLQPPLTVHKVDCGSSPLALLGGKDVDRLPSASTCYNMLKLPNYKRAATMRQKLLYAIGAGAGFELS